MNNDDIEKLVSVADDLVNTRNDDLNHTVASSILTQSGKVVSAMNLYHFTGGLCAEVVAFARMVSNGEKPVLIVAVGNKQRNVLAPCGRCRQIMFDYYPEIKVVVPSEKGNLSIDIKELLPYTYSLNDQ